MSADPVDAFDEVALRNGERVLWAALAAAVIYIPAMMGNKPGIAITCLVASWLGGVFGIYQVARSSGGNRIVALLAIVASFMLILNFVVFGVYIKRARSALKEGTLPLEEEAPPARMAPQPSPAPAASTGNVAGPAGKLPADWSPSWSPARARHELASAIAMVKHAGLTSSARDAIPDGELLGGSMKLPNGESLPEESQPVVRASRGAFGVMYALDRGQDFIFTTRGDMAKAGLTLHELHEIGLHNLGQQCNGTPGLKLLPQEGGWFGLVMGGHFEASLVLLDQIWDEALKEHIPNGAVVGIPARDKCVFCDAKSREGIAKVHDGVKRVYATGDHVLSDKLFLRRDGQWRMLGSGA